MEKTKKNEELQSRREFFKRAAKGALPILGAIVLAGAPAIVKAVEESPMGCKNGCSGGCLGSCRGGCSGSCHYGCTNSCNTTCQHQCKTSCKGGNYGH